MEINEKDKGPQPLDTLMSAIELTNAMLVGASTTQLTFRMVQRGRNGRRLTPNGKRKILEAMNNINAKIHYEAEDLFNY
ncbi:MAG: hypothetical protein ACI9CF_000882 [Candidatus Omnitrophota bacterium]|jgi:hypothetical protein